MPLDLLEGAQGIPTRSQRRIMGQSALGIPYGAGTIADVCQNGGPIKINVATVPRRKISQGGAPSAPLVGKRNVEPISWDLGDINPVDKGLLHGLASLFGFYDIADVTTFYRHTFGLDGGTAADPYLLIQDDDDFDPRKVVYDAKAGKLTISASAGDNYAAVMDLLAGSYHFFADAVQTSGSGSTVPVLKAAYSGAWEEDRSEEDIYIQVQSFSGGVVTFRAKRGVSASYGGTDYTHTAGGDPTTVFDESDVRIGPIRDAVKIWWPASATLTALDEFRIDARRARWNPSFPTDRAIASVNTSVIIDGVQRRIENGWSHEIGWTVFELKPDTSGAQSNTVRRVGFLDARFSLDRELTDLDLQKSLHEATKLSVVVEGETDEEIAGASRPFLFRSLMPAAQAEGSLYGTEPGGENTNEPIVLVGGLPTAAFEWPVGSGLMYSSHAHVVIENDVAAL